MGNYEDIKHCNPSNIFAQRRARLALMRYMPLLKPGISGGNPHAIFPNFKIFTFDTVNAFVWNVVQYGMGSNT